MSFERVGIIGDIHAEAVRLEAALHFLQKKNVECVLCVGDIVDGQGNVDRCCELLKQNNVIIVRGNHDRWFMEGSMRNLSEATQQEDISEASKNFIESLPATQSLETTAGQLLLCHGLSRCSEFLSYCVGLGLSLMGKETQSGGTFQTDIPCLQLVT